MYKFVDTDGKGHSQKRQQVARACDRCRKRKKRCCHTSASTERSQNRRGQTIQKINPSSAAALTPNSIIGERSSKTQENHTTNTPLPENEVSDHDAHSHVQGQGSGREDEDPSPAINSVSQDHEQARFIGDLNPEAVFAAATSPNYTSRGASLEDSIGVWLTSNPNGQSSSSSAESSSSLFYGAGLMIQKLLPILEQECLSVIPSDVLLEALSRIYFDKIHPILPAVDRGVYTRLDPSSPAKILLQQGICLAASKNYAVRHLLVLPGSTICLSPRQFNDRISSAMRTSIEMGLIKHKKILISSLLLLSQFKDSPGDILSQLCGKAVHHTQSIGLHLKGRGQDREEAANVTLFCCVWAVDRMNAAFNGRPIIMHERDMREDLEECFQQQDPCFRAFLEVVSLLDRIIVLYRPQSIPADMAILELAFPSFEEIALKCGGAQHISASALTTIEILYHAVAILSCRSKTWADPHRSSMSYIRQSLSTSILASGIRGELHYQQILFPFVPYAISLAMSIVYREMRHSKLPSHRTRSQIQLQTLTDALSELGDLFWIASTMSEMGLRLLREIDRVSTTTASLEKRHSQYAVNNTHQVVFPAVSERQAQHQHNSHSADGLYADHITSTQDFDPSIFDSMDIDLFDLFDPAFDLAGFDASLEGNLNPALPGAFECFSPSPEM